MGITQQDRGTGERSDSLRTKREVLGTYLSYRSPQVMLVGLTAVVVVRALVGDWSWRDPLMVALIAEIRLRGNPVSVVVPEEPVRPTRRSPRLQRRRVDQQADRLASVEQEMGRLALEQRGVPIVEWPTDESVETIVEVIFQLALTAAVAFSNW